MTQVTKELIFLAGPKFDIIGGTSQRVGYLARSEEEYAMYVTRAMTKYLEDEH